MQFLVKFSLKTDTMYNYHHLTHLQESRRKKLKFVKKLLKLKRFKINLSPLLNHLELQTSYTKMF